jgi:hypothetical protein
MINIPVDMMSQAIRSRAYITQCSKDDHVGIACTAAKLLSNFAIRRLSDAIDRADHQFRILGVNIFAVMLIGKVSISAAIHKPIVHSRLMRAPDSDSMSTRNEYGKDNRAC